MKLTTILFLWIISICPGATLAAPADAIPSSEELYRGFAAPDHARWGEVPLWWWEGDRMENERITWQLETLAAQGVKSVCPIQRSPGRCDPASFTPEWWKTFAYVHNECERLGMTLWVYDQVGYGHYGWLEKAAAQVQDPRTCRIEFLQADGGGGVPIQLDLPEGDVLGAHAYPLRDGVAEDGDCRDVRSAIDGRKLTWQPPAGSWRVAVSVIQPHTSFYLSDKAADAFVDMFYGKIERTVGKSAMGSSLAGVFQDEHPATPRDIYTRELAEAFRKQHGYDLARALPALHFDVGRLTPKYRLDFYDTYLTEVERTYWKRVYDWTWERRVLTSHDNWGRGNIYRQTQGYIDYFRSQRWFSAPGYDDAGRRPLQQRNYYDTKIAASIARLYHRPRVWSEAFHSSGWGRSTEETLTWLSANYAFGANLYDEHGLYYSTRAATWEHAAPDPHWRQPYWRYYQALSDWVARISYLMSQGTHVVDVAVHYPVVSVLAGQRPGVKGPNHNHYMQLSQAVYNAGMDNDIIDDDSLRNGRVQKGRLTVAGNGYQALVFGPMTTVRRSVLAQALELAQSGGVVVFVGPLPDATVEGGREDPQLAQLLTTLLGKTAPKALTSKKFPQGGFAAWIPDQSGLPSLIDKHIQRDVQISGGTIFTNHRRIGDTHVYLLQSAEAEDIDLNVRLRADGVAQWWDPLTGKIKPVRHFQRRDGMTWVEDRLEGNCAQLLVLRPGPERSSGERPEPKDVKTKALNDDWSFSVIPTRDNRWGELRWPPSEELIGPEVRAFNYREEQGREQRGKDGLEQGWHRPDVDESRWSKQRYSIGPYWLGLENIKPEIPIDSETLGDVRQIQAGAAVTIKDTPFKWKPVAFSKTIGLARPAPWGGHSGYPDGAVDENFIDLPAGRKLLFTRLRSPRAQRLGLSVQLRNTSARLWVNGVEQPFEDAIGNLPLRAGINTILLELPDGGKGRLVVQRTPPSVSSLEDLARGMARPDLRQARWIRDASAGSGYLRKTFALEGQPTDARLTVTAYTGYQLFINGKQVEEEIGPWAKWTHPETLNVARYLRAGRNVIAAWVQLYKGQHVKGDLDLKGFALALKVRLGDAEEVDVVSDATWKGTAQETTGWEQIDFDDAAWASVEAPAKVGEGRWGTTVLQNVDKVTQPRRRRAVDLPSPYLECFQEVPEVAYDIKPEQDARIGWCRFQAPPGLHALTLPTEAQARVWVDGQEAHVDHGRATVSRPVPHMSTVAIRLQLAPGSYGGAAFDRPIGLTLKAGKIRTGKWADYALPTYAGLGVYQQTVHFSREERSQRIELDLGQVLVAAEVLVNGQSAGVRLARPFKFDLTDHVREGDNHLEIRVANTIAPHYTVTNKALHPGPTDSGLLGPVQLRLQ